VLRVVGVKMTVVKIMSVVVDMGESAVFVHSVIMAVNMQIILMLFICSSIMLVLMSMGDLLTVIMLFLAIIMVMFIMVVALMIVFMVPRGSMFMCLFIA
jgi:hypothetical protein